MAGLPYRLNLHDNDVGHTLLVGPTGAGKSVRLALFVAQWFRYPKAQVFAFDKGHSLYAFARPPAADSMTSVKVGCHFSLSATLTTMRSSDGARSGLRLFCVCRAYEIGPAERQTIHRALRQLATAPRERRTLTELEANLQDEKLKAGIQPYVIDGPLGGCSIARTTV